MNTAAHQAASDAARTRRNAKVAGDVVRRCCNGGGNGKSSSGGGNGKSSSGGGIKNSMKIREVHNENNYNSHDNADDVNADKLLHNDDMASKKKAARFSSIHSCTITTTHIFTPIVTTATAITYSYCIFIPL
jgi:hypothetical protein